MSIQTEVKGGQKSISLGGTCPIEMHPLCVTIKQACTLMSIGRSTFFKLEKEGRISVLRLGTKVLVPMANIHEFLAKLPSSRPSNRKRGS